jgi:hypothetical protein
MSTRIFGLAMIASIALLAGSSGQASAVSVSSCTSEYTASNGTTSLPGTNIGTVEAGCEIGPFVQSPGPYTNLSGTPGVVNDTANPSIYEFTWNGGNLTIQEELGNNGIGNNINVELGLLSNVTLSWYGSLSGTGVVSSETIAFQSGPGAPVAIITDYNLPAGTYVLDTYLGTCGAGQNCSDAGTSTDPNYAVLFSPVSATPLPAALPLFATGLGLVGMFGWRRKRKIGAATA